MQRVTRWMFSEEASPGVEEKMKKVVLNNPLSINDIIVRYDGSDIVGRPHTLLTAAIYKHRFRFAIWLIKTFRYLIDVNIPEDGNPLERILDPFFDIENPTDQQGRYRKEIFILIMKNEGLRLELLGRSSFMITNRDFQYIICRYPLKDLEKVKAEIKKVHRRVDFFNLYDVFRETKLSHLEQWMQDPEGYRTILRLKHGIK